MSFPEVEMPIYEYQCKECSFRFEVRKHFNEDGATPCPQCRGESRRLFSVVPIIFKGPGFYTTDSRKGYGETSPDKGESDKGASERGPGTER
jgi:putative FmdB family regulatory protein